jgi:hypothetical protein
MTRPSLGSPRLRVHPRGSFRGAKGTGLLTGEGFWTREPESLAVSRRRYFQSVQSSALAALSRCTQYFVTCP